MAVRNVRFPPIADIVQAPDNRRMVVMLIVSAIFIAALAGAVVISLHWNVVVGIIGGFAIGIFGWVIASFGTLLWFANS